MLHLIFLPLSLCVFHFVCAFILSFEYTHSQISSILVYFITRMSKFHLTRLHRSSNYIFLVIVTHSFYHGSHCDQLTVVLSNGNSVWCRKFSVQISWIKLTGKRIQTEDAPDWYHSETFIKDTSTFISLSLFLYEFAISNQIYYLHCWI